MSGWESCVKNYPNIWKKPEFSEEDKKVCEKLSQLVLPDQFLQSSSFKSTSTQNGQCSYISPTSHPLSQTELQNMRQEVYEKCSWMQRTTRTEFLAYYEECNKGL